MQRISHIPKEINRAFQLALVLNSILIAGEFSAGWWWHSLALISDAWHNLSDVLALALAWSAAWLATWGRSPRHSYGLQRATILAAIVSAAMLAGAVVWIGLEAWDRLHHPVATDGLVVFWIAALAVLVNAASAWLFHAKQAADLNLRANYLHLATDAALSAGVMIAGLGIYLTGWMWLDPAVSLGITAFILALAWRLLRQTVSMEMNAVPDTIDVQAVEHYLRALPDVIGVHDLHIWPLSTSQVALTVHLVMNPLPDSDRFLTRVQRDLKQKFDIHHPTLQLEHGDLADGCAHQHPNHI